MLQYIIQQTRLSSRSISNTLSLLNEDATIPFIARYRKEITGNLDEVQIGAILQFKDVFEALEKRKKAITKALEEQGVLTAELSNKVHLTKDLIALEDVYLPYKKKRKTKAETARLQGLEPLAKMIMAQQIANLESTASKYLNNEILTTSQALEASRFIIAEWINERTDVRNSLRNQISRFGSISSKVIKTKINDEKAQKFKDYFEWQEALNRIPSHRFLAILRAEKEGFVRVKITIDENFYNYTLFQ